MSGKNQVSRPPLVRMLRIHEALKAGEWPNCRSMAQVLEVSDKTIQRDLEFMRDQLGLPIEYDPQKFGYHYTEEVVAFPTIQVGEGELLALVVAQRALAQYRGTVWADRLQAACQKLASSMQGKVLFNLDEWTERVSFRTVGTPEVDLEIFEAAGRALAESRELVFGYRKLKGAEEEIRRLEPHHLTCVDGQWYLIGHDPDRGSNRTFALTRMRSAKLTERKFVRPKDPSLPQGGFGIFSGDRLQEVVLRFEGLAALLVAERTWHPTQQLKTLPDGRVEVGFKLGDLTEIQRWILGWSGEVEVIRPKELRDNVVRELQRGLGMHGPRRRTAKVR
ncbi:MAG: transcriptional regulator [Candidatus Methylacidiphilales bacterium]